MKTEYQVLHRPRHDDQAAAVREQLPTLDEARRATGYTSADHWEPRSRVEGTWYLSEQLRGRLNRRLLWLIVEVEVADTDAERVSLALDMAVRYGGIEGGHHKTWVIDQVVRILAGDRYGQVIAEACDGEDGPDTYEWDTGIAP